MMDEDSQQSDYYDYVLTPVNVPDRGKSGVTFNGLSFKKEG